MYQLSDISAFTLLGSAGHDQSLTVPSNAFHVVVIVLDTITRAVSLDLYPNISPSGDYAVGSYYFNGAGMGVQIQWKKDTRKVKVIGFYVDGVNYNNDTMYVYYR